MMTPRIRIDDPASFGKVAVLLGGDSDILPPRYVDNSYYPTAGSTLIPTDLYFACLDGNWNANGNSYFGEPANNPNPGDLVDFADLEPYEGVTPWTISRDSRSACQNPSQPPLRRTANQPRPKSAPPRTAPRAPSDRHGAAAAAEGDDDERIPGVHGQDRRGGPEERA